VALIECQTNRLPSAPPKSPPAVAAQATSAHAGAQLLLYTVECEVKNRRHSRARLVPNEARRTRLEKNWATTTHPKAIRRIGSGIVPVRGRLRTVTSWNGPFSIGPLDGTGACLSPDSGDSGPR
jgi:hypothetical protein